jgi:hypothetical protein
MNRIYLILFALVLSACSTAAQQALTGYEASAIKSVQAADDNAIFVETTGLCATPFSATIRHPEIVQAMKALCLPNGGTSSSSSTLLDALTPAVK